MRIIDVLVGVTAAIQGKRTFLTLGDRIRVLVPMSKKRWSLSLKGLIVESVSPEDKSIMGRMSRDGRIILRAFEKQKDPNSNEHRWVMQPYGTIDGKYFNDIETAVTQMAVESGVL